jgi:toxin ParE1/3/4
VRHAFHPEAAAEFADAVQFYHQRGPKLARRFAREVRSTISKVVAAPEQWRILEADVHRCLVRVFPYAILYTIEPGYILILAIMHGRRRPGYWRYRLNPSR